MDSQMSSLKGVQGEIISGAENTAQSTESKLTENGERNNKKEQVSTSTYAELHK